MADIVISRFERHRHNGYEEYEGVGVFNANDATGELFVPFSRILSFSLSPIGAPNTNEGPLSIDETVTDGVVIVPAADNKVTVTRPNGTTAALQFAFNIRGK